MRVHTRVVAAVAAAALLIAVPSAFGATLPTGPVTAQTVAAAQAEATAAATAATNAARDAATAQVALDSAKAASAAAAAAAAANPTPENTAAAAAASAAQATAQQDFDAKNAASTAAAAASTAAATNASREAASLAHVNGGTSTAGTPAAGLDPDQTALPAVDKSDNVLYFGHSRGTLPNSVSCPAYNPTGCPGFSALNFIHYDNLGYDVIVANGTPGLSVWSLKDPEHPAYIAGIKAAQLGTYTGENLSQFWEGENMTTDSRRKLAFMSKDSGKKGLFTIDMKDPWNPKVISFQPTSLGHTATCINDCRFVWQVGSGVSGKKSAVSVTDIRDPDHPFTYTNLFESNIRRTTSTSGSTHSVDVDFNGVAWVSGTGGARGWWTEGVHRDLSTGQDRSATPYDPLPYGGGSITGLTGTFMHNAYHVPQALGSQPAGDVMLITNENNNTDCSKAGIFYIASLAGTRDVENNVSQTVGATAPVTMAKLGQFSVNGQPGQFHGTVTRTTGGTTKTTTVGDCSAHWFTVKGNIVALGNYEQGTRFVDISDPTNPQQVGYFRVPESNYGQPDQVLSSNTAGAYFHGKYVYVADYARGIDVIGLSSTKGDTQSKTCWNSCQDTQTMTDWNDREAGGAGGTVGATLALTLGTPATFGTGFTPGIAKDYTATGTANVISTAGDAALSVADPSATATGHLVNGTFSLPSTLQAKAASPGGTGGALTNVGGSSAPTSLLTYSGPISNDPVAVTFQQHIGSGDALRTGTYNKSLTFTLSTTTP